MGLYLNEDGVLTPIAGRGDLTAIRSEMSYLGAKNLLVIKEASRTASGVTFTINADGSVTVNTDSNGATANIWYHLNSAVPLVDGLKYILTGCPSGGSSSSYEQYITDNGSNWTYDRGNGGLYTANSTPADVVIHISSGTVLDNVLFKPMVRLASDPDDTYVPYAKTNKQLTDDTSSAIANVPNGAINLAKPSLVGTTTVSNVEFVIDSEGKVTANGTASANIRFDMAEVTLKAGMTYKICEPSSLQARRPFSPESYRCYARIKSSGVWVLQNNGWKGSYTPTADVVVSVGVAMQSGNQVTDEIFAPMLVLDGTDVGDTFYPYAMTNRELTEGAGLPKKTLIRTLENGKITVTIPKNLGSSYVQGSLKLIGSNADSEAHVTFCLNADNTAVTVSKLTNLGSKALTLDSTSISGNNLVLEISGVQNYTWVSVEYFMSLSAGANAIQPTWTFAGS